MTENIIIDYSNGYWLLPTRRRPHNLRRFFAACRNMDTTTKGLVLIDKKDYEANAKEYGQIGMLMPFGWEIVQTEAESQGDKIREVANQYNFDKMDWLGLLGDDQSPDTYHWDRILVSRLKGWNMVSCLDDFLLNTGTKFGQKERVAGTILVSGELYRTLGYFFPDGTVHVYLDDVWEEIGLHTGCWEICRDVMIKHDHYTKNPELTDETYMKSYGNNGFAATDYPFWQRWRKEELPKAVNRVRGLMERLKDA